MKKRIFALLIICQFAAILFSFSANAHITSDDTYVRVVSANPDTRTYTFRCLPQPERGYIKDWFIYGEKVGHNEAEFKDLPWNKDLTYTFKTDNYYHIGCIIVDPKNGSHLWRGDMHIDLRKKLFEGDVIPLEISATSAKINCVYNTNPYTVSWFVSTYWGSPSSPTKRTSMNSNQKTVTYTSPGHGLYHPRCDIKDSVTGKKMQAGIPLEFFDGGKAAYVADRYGIDLSNNFRPFNFNEWMAMFDGSAPSCTPSTEVCDSKDNDCDGAVDEGGVCTPTCTPTTETCNSIDDDCDSQIDENNVCSTSSGCVHKVNDMPAICEGGSFAQETKSGCRTLICSNGGNFLKVMACNKPDGTVPQYFEMYRQSYSGIIPKICLGSTCIQNSGYAKSPNFPICFGNSTPVCGNGIRETGEQCDDHNTNNGDGCSSTCQEESPPTSCHSTVKTISLTCSGGVITQDSFSGNCRTAICGFESNSIKVLACDKPDSGTKTHFEMYRQAYSGTAPKVCFGSTCIQNEGYVKSPNFPICS